MYDWVTMIYSKNWHNTVNQLYINKNFWRRERIGKEKKISADLDVVNHATVVPGKPLPPSTYSTILILDCCLPDCCTKSKSNFCIIVVDLKLATMAGTP